jgi:hypothetical protein
VFSDDINNKIKFEKEEALLDEVQDRLARNQLWASKETLERIRAVLSTINQEVQSGTRESFRRTSKVFTRRERKTGGEQAANENADQTAF